MSYKSSTEKEEHLLNGAIADSPLVPEEFEFEQDLPSTATKGKPKPKGGWLTPTVLGMGLGAALAVVGMRSFSSPTGQKAVEPTVTAPPPSMTVTVASVVTASVVRTLDATGTVAAYNLQPVQPQTTGLLIKQVLVEEGNIVKAGQIVAILDNSVMQTQVSGAQAQLEASRAAVQQKQAALAQTQADMGKAQAVLAQAEAERVKAQANLADSRAKLKDASRTRQRYQYLADQGAINRQDLDTRITSATSAAEGVRVAQASISSAIANIDSAKASISSAQASINSAKANVLSAQADVRNNEAKVQQIETQLGQTQVFAPASGIVVAPSADGRCDGNATSLTTAASQSIAQSISRVGDTSGSKALFCIIRNGFLELQVKIPETALSEVHIGAPVSITSDANTDIKWQGRVRRITPVIDPQTRQATIKIDLPSSALMKPGMFLKAAITSKTAPALTVPAKAIQRQSDGNPIVYLLDANDIVHTDPVEVGTTIDGNKGDASAAKVEIKSGLKEGDRIVVAGAGYIKDGDKVRIGK
ncbi:efflux RND transporter periplasmic adaptor subunit [Argonema antarcticum]|uniref:efflux RND transporter periplasmic adaptor subunit n=1 Tax=Argonema antarcticum TaxID=2942763 RepID=UPI00201391E0|nr:efflux RND transporter periplasmic adaptor subunit [Argonema antarcticum A004/B2]